LAPHTACPWLSLPLPSTTTSPCGTPSTSHGSTASRWHGHSSFSTSIIPCCMTPFFWFVDPTFPSTMVTPSTPPASHLLPLHDSPTLHTLCTPAHTLPHLCPTHPHLPLPLLFSPFCWITFTIRAFVTATLRFNLPVRATAPYLPHRFPRHYTPAHPSPQGHVVPGASGHPNTLQYAHTATTTHTTCWVRPFCATPSFIPYVRAPAAYLLATTARACLYYPTAPATCTMRLPLPFYAYPCALFATPSALLDLHLPCCLVHSLLPGT